LVEKFKPSRFNMITKKLKAVKPLRLSNEKRILQAHKGNCTVLCDESKYKDKMKILLKSGVYESLPKNSRVKF
jgi:hypothetical protein